MSFKLSSGAYVPFETGQDVLRVDPSRPGCYYTVQGAVDAAPNNAIIYIAPGEYNEDVVITKRGLRLIGDGCKNSVRITGTNAGTKTAILIDGSLGDGDIGEGYETGLYNLNLEGRATGSALKLLGLLRRVEVTDCKLHGGDQALLLDAGAAGGQIVDVTFDRVRLANSAIGVKFTGSGGDPHNQVKFIDPVFERITTDCVVNAGGAGAVRDLLMTNPIFAAVDGAEATQFIDIDDTGNTGLIVNPVFATTVFASSKIAIDAGIMIIGWQTEREVESTDGGTNGRPD